MAFIDAETLKSVIGKPASGPAGFDIHYDIKNGADIGAGTNAVDTHLNDKSLADARARNEGGSNKQVAALNPAKPGTGSALAFAENQRSKGDAMYQSMFAKRGMESLAERSMSSGPRAGARRSDHRNVLSQANVMSKNPLLRFKARQMKQLRKTFDEIASHKKKSQQLNAEMLPQQAKDKIVESSIAKGEHNTPFGHIPSPLATAKAVGSVAYNAWRKWDAVGALAAGSFIDLAHSLKRQ
jgi:hypothetical protein